MDKHEITLKITLPAMCQYINFTDKLDVETKYKYHQNELGVYQEAFNNNTIYTIITMIWLFLRQFTLACFQREVTVTKPMTLISSQRGLFKIICKKLQIFT